MENEEENIYEIFQKKLAEGNKSEICNFIISIALSGVDLECSLQIIERSLKHENEEVRAAAAISLGHISRMNGYLPLNGIALLFMALLDPSDTVVQQARTAYDDVSFFIPAIKSSLRSSVRIELKKSGKKKFRGE